jgi:hypothetical protein
MPGGYEGACAPGQEGRLAAVAGAPDAGVAAGAALAGAGGSVAAAAELVAAGAAEFAPEFAA